MNTSRGRVIAEAIGVVAVVGSLVFVGVEVRQNSAATRAATAQSLSDSWLEWNLQMAQPGAFASLERMYGLDDPSEAAMQDRAGVSAMIRSLLQVWSNLHYQYLLGHLDQTLWESVLRNIDGNINHRIADWRRVFLWGWEHEKHIQHVEFQQLVDSMIAASPNP